MNMNKRSQPEWTQQGAGNDGYGSQHTSGMGGGGGMGGNQQWSQGGGSRGGGGGGYPKRMRP